MLKLQLIALLLYFILGVSTIVSADYILTVSLSSVTNSNQTLASGECCEPPPDNQTACSAPCNTTLRICFRQAGHDQNDFSCPLGELIVAGENGGSWSTVYVGDWVGSLQLYILVIHDLTAKLGPLSPGNPVVGELIDFIILEQLFLAPNESPTSPISYTGRFQRATLELSFRVTCTFEFYGSLCDLFCPLARNDSLGHFMCDGNGTRVCLEGYNGLETNCTDCVPLEGCSEEGGFCVNPGECVCRHGFIGPTCSDNATSFTPSPSPSTTSTLQSSLPMTSSPLPMTSSSLPMTSSSLRTTSSSLRTTSSSLPTTSSSLPVISSIPSSSSSMNNPVTTTEAMEPLTSIMVVPSSVALSSTIIVRSVSITNSIVTSTNLEPVSSTMFVSVPSASVELSSSITTLSLPVQSNRPFPVPPSVGSVLPAAPQHPDPINIALGVILGIVVLMIVTSLTVFLVALAATYQRRYKSKSREAKRRRELRSRFVDVLHNVAAYNGDLPHVVHNGSRQTGMCGVQNVACGFKNLDQSQTDGKRMSFTDPTYTTFQDDSGTYTQETLIEDGDGVVSNRGAILEDANNETTTMEAMERLSDLMFHNERTMSQNKDDLSLGEDLLVSIRESLSQASAHNLKLSSVSQPAPNDQMESVDLGSDYAPSFIYADIFDERAQHEEELVFRTPSISPDSVNTS